MLTAARAQGIVEIRVHGHTARAAELEQALREQLGLAHVRVAAFRPGVDLLEAPSAIRAAQWLDDESLRDGLVLGLSWGTSLQATVSAVAVDQPRSGGGRSAGRRIEDGGVLPSAGQELVRKWPGVSEGTYRYLHAPALLRSEAARDALLVGTGDR